jgi:hypothetical protein
MLIPLGILATAGAGAPVAIDAFDFISTTTVASDTTSITFSSLPTDYAHLQIRFLGHSSDTNDRQLLLSVNGTNDWNRHEILGDGSSPIASVDNGQSSFELKEALGRSSPETFGGGVVELSNYTSSTLTKTIRAFQWMYNDDVTYTTGINKATTAVTEITLTASSGTIEADSMFSLYGIRG